MNAPVNLSRRRFLRDASVASGALVVGAAIPWRGALAAEAGSSGDAVLESGVLVAVGPDGRVTLRFTWNELGQGAMTSLALIVAEELRVEPASVDVVTPTWEIKYGFNTTGGSSSLRQSWTPLRTAAAAAREMLVTAGAESLGVDPGACRAEDGAVVHAGERLPYGDLVAAAAALPVPDAPTLTDRADYARLGRETPRRDSRDKTLGRAVYGFDLAEPDVPRAAVARSPRLGGTVAAVGDAAALAVPGVRSVIRLDDRVAVVADDTWSAFKGRDALHVEWSGGETGHETGAYWDLMAEAAGTEGRHARDDGDVEAGLAGAARTHEADYRLPFISHAVMEPSSCRAHVHDGVCELTGPTQSPSWVVRDVARALGLQMGQVRMDSIYVGSAFGRRLFPDVFVEAARISRELGGPVQTVWTREDEMRHAFYRPASLHRLRAGLDADGRLVAWHHKIVTPSIGDQHFPDPRRSGPDEGAMRGNTDVDYAPSHFRATHVHVPPPLRLGYLRSVYDAQNALAGECFLDELAAAAGRDPLEFRLDVLPADSRLRRVLQEAAARAGWPEPSRPGRSVGIAGHACFGSVGAQVAEVSVEGGRLRVHRVVSVLDPGFAANPDAVRAQMEGGVAMGLSILLRERITLRDGAVVEGNFDVYEPLRLPEMPAVECHILESEHEIGGVGEPVLPPTAPAVLNAVFAATGRRIRELPIEGRLEG